MEAARIETFLTCELRQDDASRATPNSTELNMGIDWFVDGIMSRPVVCLLERPRMDGQKIL